MFSFFEKLKVIRRLNYILLVFFKSGFFSLISQAGLSKHISPLRRLGRQQLKKQSELAVKFREAMVTLGPVFVKFGQILSTRGDFLPKIYVEELSKLQAKVPPFGFVDAKRIIEENFGKPIHKLFKEFENKPFASASLGQVYKAKLFSGEHVAVKVQRPKAKEQIKLDTQVLLALAHLIEKYMPGAKEYNLIETVQEFRRWTLNELDYRKEATNCEIFDNFFKKNKYIYGPKVFWDYTAESVLTLEFVNGRSLAEVIEDSKLSVEKKKELGHHIADAFIRQFYEFGFFHADPHPGNIFVCGDNKILFLDFGMVGFLDENLTAICSAMFLSIMQKDTQNMVDLFLRIEENYDEKANNQDIREIVNVNNLRKELNILMLQWSSGGAGQSGQFSKLFYDMLNIAVKNGIYIPVDLTMLGKAIVTLDVVVKRLDENFQIQKWEKPTMERIVKRKLAVKNLQSRSQNMAIIVEDLIKRLPASSANIVSNIEKGKFGMEINTQQLVDYERLLNANSKLNSYGLILAAIIVASALLYQVKDQPRILNWSIAELGLYSGVALIVLFFISQLKKER